MELHCWSNIQLLEKVWSCCFYLSGCFVVQVVLELLTDISGINNRDTWFPYYNFRVKWCPNHQRTYCFSSFCPAFLSLWAFCLWLAPMWSQYCCCSYWRFLLSTTTKAGCAVSSWALLSSERKTFPRSHPGRLPIISHNVNFSENWWHLPFMFWSH